MARNEQQSTLPTGRSADPVKLAVTSVYQLRIHKYHSIGSCVCEDRPKVTHQFGPERLIALPAQVGAHTAFLRT